MTRRQAFFAALFLDLPFLVDSFWRKAEYHANRNHEYAVAGANVSIVPRPVHRTLPFWWLLLVLVFVAYGPTHAALCNVGGSALPRLLFGMLALLAVASAWLFSMRFGKRLLARAAQRLEECRATRLRRLTLYAVSLLFLAMATTAIGAAAYQLGTIAFEDGLCESGGWHWRSVAQLALSIAVLALVLRASRRGHAMTFWATRQPLLAMVLVLVLWYLLATPSAREADQLPYRHVYAVLAVGLSVIVLCSRLVAQRLMRDPTRRLRADFVLALRHCELFVQRGDPDLSVHRVSHAIVNGAVYHPLLWLLMPSLVALVVPDWVLYPACLAAFLLATLLLAWGSISLRWQQMVLFVRRWFLTGTPLVVSLAVIVIAAARLSGNQYVATVLVAAPFGVVFMWIVMIYGLLWVFEHAINQALSSHLLALLVPGAAPREGYAAYPTQGLPEDAVAAGNRYIATHGAGRFAVVGRHIRSRDEAAVFHTYSHGELFARLSALGVEIERASGARGIAARLFEAANEVERRRKLYFNLLNGAVLVLGTVLFLRVGYHDRHYTTDPIVTAEPGRQKGAGFDLAAKLAEQARNGRPAIVIAASGGGTRAAVYTASVLEGLAELGVAGDIVLMSGVSGGGVAIADFAIHRKVLAQGAPLGSAAWDEFTRRVSQPFIKDVLEGAMEWRLVGSTPLTALLAESFARRIDHDAATPLGAADFGLILNTSITGHPVSDSAVLSNAMQPRLQGIADADCIPYAYLSGARLAFTNLQQLGAFPQFRASRLPDVGFGYALVSDPTVPLMAAAALNANFPPVFPNARVDLLDNSPDSCDGRRSYYVTDGGATEDLGLLSALYALRSALAEWPADTALPAMHIIAIEASAADFDYRQDRGIGTATDGAKERVAGGLTETLLRGIEARTVELRGESSAVQLHYLAMPLALRSRGGVGTHWMLAENVLVTNPHRVTPLGMVARTLGMGSDDRVRIEQCELIDLLGAMHSAQADFCPPPAGLRDEVRKVADWICGAKDGVGVDLHVTEWRRLTQVLAAQEPPQPPRQSRASARSTCDREP